MKTKFFTFHVDFIGFTASVICALHCALMPLILTLLPLAGLEFLENPLLEYSLIATSLLIALNSFIKSYFKIHCNSFPIKLLACGFIMILIAHLINNKTTELILSSLGGLSIALAHYINWYYKKYCEKCNK